MTRSLTSRILLAFLALTGALALTGCEDKKLSDKGVMQFSKRDSEMNAAIAKAQGSVQEFVARLQKPQPGDKGFSVKAPIVDGDHTEHFWLVDVRVEGTNFVGKVSNEPEMVKTVKFGDRYTIPIAAATDWMYTSSGKLVGGQTVRVMFRQLPKDQQEQMEKDCGFRIEE